MSTLTRRRFCVLGASAAAVPSLLAQTAQHEYPFDMVARVDRARIMRLAAQWLPAKPDTITSHRSPRNPGNEHDFFSEADYFWPNPANPNGPYKEIDGKSNPDNFLEHRRAMIRLSQAVPALAAAYALTHKPVYARAANAHLQAWFVTGATRMNPNLDFAQGVRNGGPKGRSYGIIDTLHLVEVARAAQCLRTTMPKLDYMGIQDWFSQYLEWMRTSDPGLKERDATNNHGICWALQAAEFARLTGNEDVRQKVRERFRNIQLPDQMGPDGSFPRELARTKPYGYSIFNFDVAATLCWSLSESFHPDAEWPEFSPASMHRPDGEPPVPGDMIRYTRPDGKGMCKGAAFLYPYLKDKSTWPYKQDVQHWESWPVRSPGLLFCGLACSKPEYIALWRTLDPDPADPEIIRNFPVRQPLLWV